jgi:hypothetical protein
MAVGISMAPPADAGPITLSEWDTASVTDGQTYYTLQANEGTPFASEYEIANDDGGPDFWVSQSNLDRATTYGPAYPSLYVGLHWPNPTNASPPATNPSSGDPLETGGLSTSAYNQSVAAGDGGYGWWATVAGLEDANPSLITSYDTSHSNVSSSASEYDTSYDIWFNSSDVGNQLSGTTPSWYTPPSDDPTQTTIPGIDLEMMIWLNDDNMTPEGDYIETVTVDGASYQIFYDNHNPTSRTITFRAVTGVSDLDNTAIADFASKAIAFSSAYPDDPTLTSSWYLYDVEAGFEIYEGGGPVSGAKGLTASSFSYLQCPADGCG